MAKLWLEWDSTTTQQARNEANGDIKDVKTCRIFAINIRKRGSIRGEMAKPERNNRGEKYADRLEMFIQMGTTLV